MPGRKANPVICTCDSCCSTAVGGRPFPSAIAKSAHLARVRLERSSSIPAQHPDANSGDAFTATSAERESDDLAAQVFATALLDPGPDLITQPSRIWTSRAHFQSDRGNDIPTELPLPLIFDGFRRLQEANDRLSTSESAQTLLSSTPATAIVDSTNIVQSIPTSPQKRSAKLDRKSEKSLNILRNLQRRIVVSLQTLASPPNDTLCKAEREIDTISLGLEQLSCRKHVVVEQKQA